MPADRSAQLYDTRRSRILVMSTAVEVGGKLTLGNEPKTRRSKRVVPVARSVMKQIEQHLDQFVGLEGDALAFTAAKGGPIFRSMSSHHDLRGHSSRSAGVWQRSSTRAEPSLRRLDRVITLPAIGTAVASAAPMAAAR